jgi:hypothetical protein
MFVDREAARHWLKEIARAHNVTAPVALRGITNDAWQTYRKELGYDELEENHCFIYRELLREIIYKFPDQNDSDLLIPGTSWTIIEFGVLALDTYSSHCFQTTSCPRFWASTFTMSR